MTARPQRGDALALEGMLLLGVDRLQRAGLAQLDVLAVVELHGFEDVEAAGGEVRLQIRLVAQAEGVDAAHVHAGGAGSDLAALEQRHAMTERGEVIRRRRAGDAAAYHEDFRLARRHARALMVALPVLNRHR